MWIMWLRYTNKYKIRWKGFLQIYLDKTLINKQISHITQFSHEWEFGHTSLPHLFQGKKKNIVENIFMYVYYKIWNSIIFI